MGRVLVVLLFVFLPFAASHAQQAPRSDDGPVCLRFAFGSWKPPLDWRAAGHEQFPDTSKLAHAPHGRDWAMGPPPGAADTTMILFPAWWPVGVLVELPTRTLGIGDTVVGIATALKGRGDTIPAPHAQARAWRVTCAR